MENINALSNFIIQTLNPEEVNYLVSRLTNCHTPEFQCGTINKNEIFNDPKDRDASLLTVSTLTKRELKYKSFKLKLLIQKPKTIQKLKNSINQIAKSDGGLSDEFVDKIVNELIVENIIKRINDTDINWLR